MSEVQVIEQGGKPAFYVVPAALWEKVRGKIEDLDDEAAFDRAVANDDGVRFPADVAHAIAGGVHPVRAWREHRKLTQDAWPSRQASASPSSARSRAESARVRRQPSRSWRRRWLCRWAH